MTSRCCLCGKEFDGDGHHPAPLSNIPTDRCCDKCYTDLVEPMQALISVRKVMKDLSDD
jgi:hypothetical protein